MSRRAELRKNLVVGVTRTSCDNEVQLTTTTQSFGKNSINGKPHMNLRWPTQLTKNLTESGAGWDASPLQGCRLDFVTITLLYTWVQRNNME